MLPATASNRPDYLRLLLYILAVGTLLFVGRPLLIPLSFGLLISFTLYPVCKWLEKRRVPRSLAIGISLLLLLGFIGALIMLLVQQFLQFTEEWPSLRNKLISLIKDLSIYLSLRLKVPLEKQSQWLETILMTGAQQIIPMVRQFLYSTMVGTVMFVLIPFYAALILYYREEFLAGFSRFFPSRSALKMRQLLRQTIVTYYNFIKGMALVYLIVAILNVLGLLMLQIPHALLFGVIASLLTFIPYVGISLGSLLPITIAWLTYDSIWYPLGVIGVFTFVQYLEANVIFPIAVSYRLQVNTLFMILAIIAGGIIWGAAGMILFVPFLGILKLLSDQSEDLGPVSQLLGHRNQNPLNQINHRKILHQTTRDKKAKPKIETMTGDLLCFPGDFRGV